MTQLYVDVDVTAAAGMLDGIEQRLSNPRPLLQLLAEEIRDYEKDVFRTGGFGRWEALDPETAQRKGSSRILVDTGGLLESLTRYPARNAVQTITEDSVTVASTDVAGVMAQRRKPARNPAPAPSRAQVAGWAQRMLRTLLDGRA